MAFVSISGFKYHDADGNGRRASTLIKGSNPDVVLVLDVSGHQLGPSVPPRLVTSTRTVTAYHPRCGNLRCWLLHSLLAQGFEAATLDSSHSRRLHRIRRHGRSKIGIFQRIRLLRRRQVLYDGGWTNFTDALTEAQALLDSWGSTQSNIIFPPTVRNSGDGISVAQS